MRGGDVVRRAPALANELVLVAVLIALQIAVTVSFARTVSGHRSIDALAIVLLVVGPLALMLRHIDPAAPVVVTVGVLAIYTLRNYWLGPVFLAFGAALIIAELAGRSIVARLGGAAVVALLVTCLALDRGPLLDAPQVFGISASITVVIALSAQVRVRSEASRQRAQWRAEEARRVASEGRLQLARDLHDVLAHSLSVINVQAGVALHLIDDDPDQVRSALTIIKKTSRETLTEVRDALGTLRGSDAAPVAPTVGLHDLDRLVDAAHASGLKPVVEIVGAPRDLPPRIDIAAYRIVQESLTNVTKHSAAESAQVVVAYRPDAVVLTVHDPGPALPRPESERGTGHGIQGMKERAADLGGQLSAGRRFDGGFTVEAAIPTREAT